MIHPALSTPVYLDANATTPVLEPVAEEVMNAMLVEFGNPSSSHIAGVKAKRLLEHTRAQARKLIGAKKGELLFTSGATEGIQTAVVSVLSSYMDSTLHYDNPVLLYGATEHKAVPNTLHHWNKMMGLNAQVLEIPVNKDGILDQDFISTHICQAVLICTMAVNNETGVIQDLQAIEKTIRTNNSDVAWLVDCVQGLGKIELNMDSISIDYAPFSGHKLYAPKGIGFLYIRAERPYTPFIAGGGQEAGMRSGTENLPGIAGLSCLFELMMGERSPFKPSTLLAHHRTLLIAALNDTFDNIDYHSKLELSVPTTINFSVPSLSSKEIMDLFDAAGIRVSGGSACSAGAKSSFVLEAMGHGRWQCENAIRLSFGPADSTEFIELACKAIRRLKVPLRHHCLSGSVVSSSGPICALGLTQIEHHGESCWMFVGPDLSVIIYNPIEALIPKITTIVTHQNLRLKSILVKNFTVSQFNAKDELYQALNAHGAVSIESPPDCHQYHLSTETFEGRPCYRLNTAANKTVIFADGNVSTPLSFDLLCSPAGSVDAANAPFISHCSTDFSDIYSFKAAIEWLEQHNGVVLDVREPIEHDVSTAKLNALFELNCDAKLMNISVNRLADAFLNNQLDCDTAYLLVCRTGTRSKKAQQALHRLGAKQIANFHDGMALY
ncbi:aminotransferase class V-fold PLP-dependent enzyme [Pseudoalteromonas sp. SMS1]|uniref:aminotransferase class V-fold PLP-dependent enzyme n=1 Tax=Pseudoalteromonas sp. SMS1 TaxID=2908894 RepID=UPI001F3EEF02|nr:aminotransferase class V-fold PLP-dependent enzyme [Pseudoalteromonas sp. SMS1]MCF2858272.1 aminotransferase class V-fold PLP-dependent enzyme [Pseudoalteromonas sp. SMS1]